MRSFLFFLLTITASTTIVFAQLPADYKFEIGVNGGVGFNTLPTGPDVQYTGSKTMVGQAYALSFHYNMNERWQIGVELSQTYWKTTAMWALTDVNNQVLQPQKVTFNIANPAVGALAQLNRLVGYRSKYKEYNKANFYYGISFGTLVAKNDGSMSESTYGQNPDPKLVYTSQYNYGYGIGYLGGAQIGLSYYIWETFGVNVELAGRVAHVWTNDYRYNGANSEYNIFYFPCTVGLRYRF